MIPGSNLTTPVDTESPMSERRNCLRKDFADAVDQLLFTFERPRTAAPLTDREQAFADMQLRTELARMLDDLKEAMEAPRHLQIRPVWDCLRRK